jgi:hypothetical protein
VPLLSSCTTSSTPFAKQPDGMLLLICIRHVLLISVWGTQIEEDPSLRDDFHWFIDGFSSLSSYETFFVHVVSGDNH